MKKRLNVWTKTMALMALLVTSISFANAQTGTDPAWPISKDVQKIANQKSLSDPSMRRSHIRAKSLDAHWFVSKRATQASRESMMAKGNVASKGTPSWVISKGVQRIGR